MKNPSNLLRQQGKTSLLLAGMTILAVLLNACTPSHDWRDIHGDAAPYSVLLPAKPASQTRQFILSGTAVSMTLTAAEADHVTYSVGSVELADFPAAKKAMLALKTALAGHVGGAILKERAIDTTDNSQIDLEAVGAPKGESRVVVARFIAHGKFAYQAVVTGPEKSISRDQIDTFLSSFKVK